MKKTERAGKPMKIGNFRKEKKSARAGVGKVFGYIFGALMTVLLVCFITGIIVGSAFAIYISKNIDPTVDPLLLSSSTGERTTKIYYCDFSDRVNRVFDAVEMEDERIYGTENSLWASYDEIPEYLREAFVSIEDKRFWTHKGVDWRRTTGAVLNFFLGGSSYGGSTITQQLIKNATGDDETTIQRKVQEILRALNLEKSMSKEQIIEMYLNIVPLSQSCIGVRAAAETYFDKELDELTLAECASLASITKYPTKYDPIQNPENNIKRRNDILNEMWEQGKISDEEYESALAEELHLATDEDKEDVSSDKGKVNSWYIDTVISDVRNDLVEQYGISRELASNLINSGGLSIYILMDPEVQDVMERVYANEENFPANKNGGIQAQSAMAVVDPYTGDLLGVVGARGEKRGNLTLNYATQTKRAPGSSLKPLSVYGPAIEEGIIHYGSVFDDVPLWFNGDTPYPKNSPDRYGGLTTVASAVERSVNTVAMRIVQELTPEKSFEYLTERFGFDYLIERQEDENGNVFTDIGLAAMALGQLNYGVTVRDMAAAYTVFPSGGVCHESHSYLYVYDSDGNVLLSNDTDTGSTVFSPETAFITTMLLKNVVNHSAGTAYSISLRKSVDVAGKTGTAGNDYDRWFCGFTPYYVGAVWYGYSYPKAIGNISNPSNKIFDLVMTELHEKVIAESRSNGIPLRSFDDNRPSDIVEITYCKDSGQLLTDACGLDPRGSRAETGYFTRSNAPSGYCETHVIVQYDSTTNAYAHEYSDPANLYPVALLRETERAFPHQIYVIDAQYVCRDLPAGVRPAGWWGAPYFENALPAGTFVGITDLGGGRQFNSFSYENYDFSRFDPPAPVAEPAEEPMESEAE